MQSWLIDSRADRYVVKEDEQTANLRKALEEQAARDKVNGGEMLVIDNQNRWIGTKLLDIARAYGLMWNSYIAAGRTEAQAKELLVRSVMTDNPVWTRDQAYQHVSWILKIARAAGYIR